MSSHFPRRRLMQAALASTVGAPWMAWAQAGWPSKPVTMIVPFPAGGGTDAFARPLAAQFARLSGKNMVIDNRGGAGGTLGAGVAARAAPRPTVTPCSWGPCTTPSRPACTRGWTMTSSVTWCR